MLKTRRKWGYNYTTDDRDDNDDDDGDRKED